MAFRERINRKTGKIEYAYRYYYLKNGKKVDSNTGWFSTKLEAKRVGENLKLQKETAEKDIAFQRQNKLVKTAFNEFIDAYEDLANRDTTDNTCTDASFWRRAKTIRENYFPSHIQKTKVGKITPSLFRDWLLFINERDLSGAYVRTLKATLSKFNKWLRDNSYYEDKNLDLDIDVALQRTTIKPKAYKNREKLGKRKVLSPIEVERVCTYFYEKGIEEFKNFYFYTLYYVLFFSGMRVEELIALQWKFIKDKKIYIENAINEREKKSNVYNRINSGIYHTKNSTSKRIIPIFDFYYDLLLDYKDAYKYEFNLNYKEMENCFVFPKLKNHNPYEYQVADRLTIVLQGALSELGIGNSDCQMLRHSCATFLVLPHPDGLGFEEQKVIDYFGHSDTMMLKDVYAKITNEQKAKRLQNTFNSFYTPDVNEEVIDDDKSKIRLIERMKGNNPDADLLRSERIHRQILRAIKQKQKKYGYLARHKAYIDSFILQYPEEAKMIIFVEE